MLDRGALAEQSGIYYKDLHPSQYLGVAGKQILWERDVEC